jgi:hypothetical protein
MTVVNQLANKDFFSLAMTNGSSAEIASGLGVMQKVGTDNSFRLPTASSGVTGTMGVLLDTTASGAAGRVCKLGLVNMTANGTIIAGDPIMISDTTAKLGFAIKATTTKELLGQAMTGGADADTVTVWVNVTGATLT